jgi:hypothetical protein
MGFRAGPETAVRHLGHLVVACIPDMPYALGRLTQSEMHRQTKCTYATQTNQTNHKT